MTAEEMDMDVHQIGTFTDGRSFELSTPTHGGAASPAPEPMATGSGGQRRRWAAIGCVAVASASLGLAGGFVVADDSDQVRDLEAQQKATDDDLGESERDLRRVEDDLRDERAAHEATLDRLTPCEQASESASSLVVVVDELRSADLEFQGTPVGSAAEAAAAGRIQAAFLQLIGESVVLDQAADECLTGTDS